MLLTVLYPADAASSNDTTVASKDMTQLQADYESVLKKLDGEQAKALTNLTARYTNALAMLETKASESDDRRSFLLIRKARDMFRLDKRLLESHITSDIPELTKLQRDYLRAFGQCPLAKANGVINLARQFDKSLEKLQQDLTKKGDTDTAVQVKAFRESLKSRPEIVQALAPTDPLAQNNAIVEIRGEIYMALAEFERINREREEAGEALFANPRNLTAGTIKQLDARDVARRKLEIILYGLGVCEPALDQSARAGAARNPGKPVILSAAKNLRNSAEILRCAQN